MGDQLLYHRSGMRVAVAGIAEPSRQQHRDPATEGSEWSAADTEPL